MLTTVVITELTATDPSVNDARNTSVYIFITYVARADFPRKYGNFPSAISSLIFAIYMTRFIATMIMTLTLMSDVDRNRMSVIATPGDV